MAQLHIPSQQLNPYAVPPESTPLLAPSTHLFSLLTSSPPRRTSHRSLLQPRPITLNTGSLTHTNGSALVRTGSTSVVCGVRAEILTLDDSDVVNLEETSPSVGETDGKKESSADDNDDPDGDEEIRSKNLLVPNIELATGCSPLHIPGGPPSALAQSLSQRILSLLHTSRIVRARDLRIYHTPPTQSSSSSSSSSDSDSDSDNDESMADASSSSRSTSNLPSPPTAPQLRAYWTLYIDILVLSHAGNIFDGAWLSVLAALQTTSLPRAYWDPDLELILCSADPAESQKLRLRGCPVPLSFSVFEAEAGLQRQLRARDKDNNESKSVNMNANAGQTSWILIDPDAFEEGSCDEKGCVVVDCTEGPSSSSDDDKRQGPKLVKLEKSGGGVVGVKEMRDIVGVAEKRWREWRALMTKNGLVII